MLSDQLKSPVCVLEPACLNSYFGRTDSTADPFSIISLLGTAASLTKAVLNYASDSPDIRSGVSVRVDYQGKQGSFADHAEGVRITEHVQKALANANRNSQYSLCASRA